MLTLVAFSASLTGCSAAEPQGNVPRLGVRPIEPAAIGLMPGSGPLQFTAGFVLSSDDPGFGGFSGLWLAPDGESLLAVSDRSGFWRFRLRADAAGRLVSVETDWVRPRSDADQRWDAEALAPLPGDRLAVSHERRDRIERRSLDELDVLDDIPLSALDNVRNPNVEALATLPDGRLLALSERARANNGDVIGLIVDGDALEELTRTS